MSTVELVFIILKNMWIYLKTSYLREIRLSLKLFFLNNPYRSDLVSKFLQYLGYFQSEYHFNSPIIVGSPDLLIKMFRANFFLVAFVNVLKIKNSILKTNFI